MFNYLKEEAFGITKRIKNRDFSGNTGQAVKNSIFQISTNIVAKVGSLIFIIIIARMLLPELFGLYSLAIATIGLFVAFSDLGIGTTVIRYLSKEFSKNNGNSKGYLKYLWNLKKILILISTFALIFSAGYIANNYYQKPIYYALLAGALFLISMGLLSFFTSVLMARNNFKIILYREIIFQILRLVLVPLAILLTLTEIASTIIFAVMMAVSVAYLTISIFIFMMRGRFHGKKLNRKQKNEVNRFILPLTATTLSGFFFGYIDQVMLGRFVGAQFIGFYSAAFALIGSAGVIIGFAGALFPIFSRLGGKRLRTGLKKALFITLPTSILALMVTILVAKYAILIVYGSEYLASVNVLRILSLLLITSSITGIYSNYFIAEGKTKFIAKAIISTTIINILLNYFLITTLLVYSQMAAVYGAAIATLISRYLYLGVLIIARKREK